MLGNFKLMPGGLGLREKHRVVCSAAMSAVVQSISGDGAADYEEFVELCTVLYNVLRASSHVILRGISMLVPALLPELNDQSHAEYVRAMLKVSQDDNTAALWFKREVELAMKSASKDIDNAVHILVHYRLKKNNKSGSDKSFLLSELHRLNKAEEEEECEGRDGRSKRKQGFVLPNGQRVGQLIPEKCRILSSAAKPILLTFWRDE